MENFQVQLPIEIIFGKDTISKLPEKVEELQVKNILIITGPHLQKMGMVNQIIKNISNQNITVFSETEANPSIETVEKAKRLYLEHHCEAIIAFGGGSPMDVAKAVGVVATYGGSIADYEGAAKVPGKICPIIAIPTTAGTGSEVTAFSVITDHSRSYKLTVFSYELIPKVAILDPVLITSLPKSIAAATGVDALVHAIEAYLSKAATTFTDAYAEKAIQLIGTNIKEFVKDRTNLEAAAAMLAGSLYAGIAFSYARLGNIHAMAHPLSGYFGIAHGVAKIGRAHV